mgnify:CR=1 FL=1|jgi:hypothetical protein
MFKRVSKIVSAVVAMLSLLVAGGLAPVSAAAVNSDSSASAVVKDQINPKVTQINASIAINYIPGYGVAVWSAPGNGHVLPGKSLLTGTTWKVYQVATFTNGYAWYNLGGNQWISAQYAGDPVLSHNTEMALNTVKTVNYVPGYGIAVWTYPEYGKIMPGKILKHGTRWRVYGEMNTGRLWYDLGGQQWIQAQYTK